MEPTPAKPVKKRRRWPIAALVVVLVVVASWWNWPRGDARFVGKWRATINGAPSTELLTLRSNGVAYYSDGKAIIWTNWSVEGTEWVSGIRTPRWMTESLHEVALWSKSVIGRAYRNRELRWTIESVEQDVIRLKYPGVSPETEIELTRVPD